MKKITLVIFASFLAINCSKDDSSSKEDYTTFRKNSTLDWHKHSTPQVLIVVDGEGYYQERGREAILIKKGDVIRCSKDTEHWHTATKESRVTYLALYDGSKPTVWTEQLTQEYYDSVANKLKVEMR